MRFARAETVGATSQHSFLAMFPLTSAWWSDAAMLGLALCTAAYYFCVSTFGKWERLNVPYARPVPLFGNFLYVAMGLVHPVDFYKSVYAELAGRKYGGLFQMRTPYLMIRDPELVTNVLIKDFSHFPDRGIYSDLSINPLSDNLFFMENPRWKVMRNKLSPAFTSGKLKLMYDQIKLCSDELMKDIQKNLARTDNVVEVKELIAKYSTDVIGTCAYGLKLNSVGDEESAFRKYGKSLFMPSLRVLLREMCLLIAPALLKIVRLKDFPSDAVEFFHSAFHDTITYREKNNVVRNDFVQVLMQARTDLVLNKNIPPGGKNIFLEISK